MGLNYHIYDYENFLGNPISVLNPFDGFDLVKSPSDEVIFNHVTGKKVGKSS